jgi:predicted nuclease of predicted toxin-antitoxin system
MLLIDQNLSRALVSELSALWPGTAHVSGLGLNESSDSEIWERAKELGRAILTKDRDFEHLAVERGAPPRVIVVAIGNCTTAEVRDLLLAQAETVDQFLRGTEALLILGR